MSEIKNLIMLEQKNNRSCLELVKIMEHETSTITKTNFRSKFSRFIGKNFYDRMLVKFGFKQYNTQCTEFKDFIKMFETKNPQFKFAKSYEYTTPWAKSYHVYYSQSLPNLIFLSMEC